MLHFNFNNLKGCIPRADPSNVRKVATTSRSSWPSGTVTQTVTGPSSSGMVYSGSSNSGVNTSVKEREREIERETVMCVSVWCVCSTIKPTVIVIDIDLC